MASPEDLLRKVVGETVQERARDSASVMALHSEDPLPVGRAELLYLWDEYRTEFLDFASAANPIGHLNEKIIHPLSDHFRYYGQTSPQGQHLLRWPVSYAKSLSQAFTGPTEPSPRKVLFCEGEPEATRVALDLAVSRSLRDRDCQPEFAVVGDGHRWLGKNWTHNWDYDPSEVDWDRLAALLISPVDDQARMIPNQVARDWILAARSAGVPVVYDESVTGFGRTGTLWGQEHSGLVADLTILGGPGRGGMPLGAVVGLPSFFDCPLDVSRQSGHPWSCVAGDSLLNAIHPGLLAHVEESSQALSKALDSLVGQFPSRLSRHHGMGLLRGLQFVDHDDARRFPCAARDRGLHLAPAVGSVVLLAPVLISSVHEVTRGVDLIADTLMSWDYS